MNDPARQYFSDLTDALNGVADQLRNNRPVERVPLRQLVDVFSARARDIPEVIPPAAAKALLEEAVGIATCDIPVDSTDRECLLAKVEEAARASESIGNRLDDTRSYLRR